MDSIEQGISLSLGDVGRWRSVARLLRIGLDVHVGVLSIPMSILLCRHEWRRRG